MVGQRRGLLAYLKKTDIERYRTLDREIRAQKVRENQLYRQATQQ